MVTCSSKQGQWPLGVRSEFYPGLIPSSTEKMSILSVEFIVNSLPPFSIFGNIKRNIPRFCIKRSYEAEKSCKKYCIIKSQKSAICWYFLTSIISLMYDFLDFVLKGLGSDEIIGLYQIATSKSVVFCVIDEHNLTNTTRQNLFGWKNDLSAK